MNSFNTQLHSDESQAAADYADYQRYLDGEYEQEALDDANAELAEVANEEATHDEDGNYIWSEEAIQFEDEMDNLYDEDEDEEWDYEDDGQPDEAQEWYDFDPDCQDRRVTFPEKKGPASTT